MRKRVCVNMTLFGSLITHGAPVSGEESSAASAAQRSDERGTTSHTHTHTWGRKHTSLKHTSLIYPNCDNSSPLTLAPCVFFSTKPALLHPHSQSKLPQTQQREYLKSWGWNKSHIHFLWAQKGHFRWVRFSFRSGCVTRRENGKVRPRPLLFLLKHFPEKRRRLWFHVWRFVDFLTFPFLSSCRRTGESFCVFI